MVTGGVGRGDTTSEATVGRRYLVAHGVPAEAVVAQAQGRTTMASMTAVAELAASSAGSAACSW